MKEEPQDNAEPSMLVYLFANRLYAQGSADYDEQVAPHILAAALWSLQQRRLVALELVAKKYLRIWGYTELMVFDRSRADMDQAGERGVAATDPALSTPELPGYYSLEGRLLDHLRNAGQESVVMLVRRLLEKPDSNPSAKLITLVKANAIQRKYLLEVPVQRSLVEHVTKSAVRIEPNTERLAAQEQPFATFSAEWEQFKAGQPALHAQLMSRCRRALVLLKQPD